MDADFERIVAAWRKDLLANAVIKAGEVDRLVVAQNADGSWPDLVYEDDRRSHWLPGNHWTRARDLARAYADPGHARRGDPEVAGTLRRAVAFWDRRKPKSRNWWYNEIFVPRQLGEILVLAPDAFDDEASRQAAGAVMRQAEIGMTGQNRAWLAQNVMMRALFEGDAPTVRSALGVVFSEIRLASPEGVRADGCFHQHGPQIQWGNYGLAFLNDATAMALRVAGTGYALSEEQVGVLRHLALDGFAWVLWNGRMDPQAMGRQTTPDSQRIKGRSVLNGFRRLECIDAERGERYRRLAADQRAGRNPLVGNRMFWNSDFMVHRGERYYLSLRMNSVRTGPVEDYVNYELALGRYFSDGALMVMVDGKEYEDIFASWNWTRLPGVTMADYPYAPRVLGPKERDPGKFYPRLATSDRKRPRGESAFTGGVSDGRFGAAAHSQRLDGVEVDKAWFFAPEGVLCLGAGLNATAEFPVATTVNQCLSRGEAKRGDGWLWHDRVAYYGDGIVAASGPREGDWRFVQGYFDKPVPDRKDILLLAVEHGLRPKDAGYAYGIRPDVDAGSVPAAWPVRMVRNTVAVQAAESSDGTVLAVFREPGTLDGFATREPGIFIIREKEVWAADPTQRLPVFTLSWRGASKTVELPGGELAGQTVGPVRW